MLTAKCQFLSHVNTFCPGLHCWYWYSLNNDATPCALATYTHPFNCLLTQKDVHVSPLPACLPHPDQNRNSIMVCLSDGSASYTQTNDTRGQHTVLRPHCSSSAVRLETKIRGSGSKGVDRIWICLKKSNLNITTKRSILSSYGKSFSPGINFENL